MQERELGPAEEVGGEGEVTNLAARQPLFYFAFNYSLRLLQFGIGLSFGFDCGKNFVHQPLLPCKIKRAILIRRKVDN